MNRTEKNPTFIQCTVIGSVNTCIITGKHAVGQACRCLSPSMTWTVEIFLCDLYGKIFRYCQGNSVANTMYNYLGQKTTQTTATIAFSCSLSHYLLHPPPFHPPLPDHPPPHQSLPPMPATFVKVCKLKQCYTHGDWLAVSWESGWSRKVRTSNTLSCQTSSMSNVDRQNITAANQTQWPRRQRREFLLWSH